MAGSGRSGFDCNCVVADAGIQLLIGLLTIVFIDWERSKTNLSIILAYVSGILWIAAAFLSFQSLAG
ncbi:MAG: hypothetical protein QOH86_377 [Sphingomonadales bacterium]|jgi:hypothetical protein|nr:hypothetical protein [Sphingomonadales bacterium]